MRVALRARMRIALLSLVLVACGGHFSETPPPPNEDGGTNDAASSSSSDARDAASATSDGAPAPDSWCAENFPYGVAMCDDFDLLSTPKPEWSATGSGLVVVDSPNVSAPHALHVIAAAGTTSSLSFTPKTASVAAKVETQLQIVADGTSASSDAPVVVSIVGDGGQTVSLAAVPGTGNARCIDNFSPPQTFADFPLSRGAWHFVSMKLSPNMDGSYNPICTVDGVDHGRPGTGTTSAAMTNITVVAGFTATTTDAMEAYYDNLVDDAQSK